MPWLKFDDAGRSQLLTDGKSSARWVIQREPAERWEMRLKQSAELAGIDLEDWTLESDGYVYFLMTEGGDGVTPALEVEAMSIIIRKRNLKPENVARENL